MSMMVSFVLSFFPRDVLDEILNLIESVSEGFPSYSFENVTVQPTILQPLHLLPKHVNSNVSLCLRYLLTFKKTYHGISNVILFSKHLMTR